MQAILILLLICVPAPRAEPPPVNPIVGAWSIDWTFPGGTTFLQTTFFYADGTCWSPEYEGGTWSEDAEGYIWFQERDGKNQFIMKPDWLEGASPLWSVCNDGTIRQTASLKIRRGEYLHHIPPRVVE